MLLAAVALTAIALLADQREVVLLLPAFLAFGIARPIATIAGSAATVGATPLEARGLSSGLVTQSRQLGAVLGVAVLGLVLTGLEIARRNHLLTGIDATFGHRRARRSTAFSRAEPALGSCCGRYHQPSSRPFAARPRTLSSPAFARRCS